ncbi:cytochrome P450 [Mycena sanguinolenta]|nr:cytochrome P450 [Mycena sanguinolenta]
MSQLLIPIAGTVAAYILFYLAKVIHVELTSPLRSLPGPKGANVVLGHFRQIDKDPTLTLKWRAEYGTNFQFRGLFNGRELWTADTKALNHILTCDHLYQKGPVSQRFVKDLLGGGLLAVEGEAHRRQNPAFGVPQIRALTEIFHQKSVQLRDIWMQQLASDPRIDVFAGLRKAALDMIGSAAFNYEFNALDTDSDDSLPNELHEAFTQLLHSPQAQRQNLVRFAQALFPVLRFLVRKRLTLAPSLCPILLIPRGWVLQPLPGRKFVRDARTKMLRIASQLLAQSKAALKTSGEGKNTLRDRDLLSMMVSANLAKDLPEEQRLSDADVIAQIPTFFVAGHETTSTATAWALHALSLNPGVQKKLREELLSLPNDSPTMDELNSLPYLESVVREAMRVHAPVEYTARTAMQDDILPLSRRYPDRHGQAYSSIVIRKGTTIRLPITAVHLEQDIWGPDAADFRPERWERLPEAVSSIPGVWGNLLTFIAGPHNCLGFRFAVVEMKVLLFTLVRAFEFGPALLEGGIGYTATPVKRPVVNNEPEKGSQLPLVVTPYVR